MKTTLILLLTASGLCAQTVKPIYMPDHKLTPGVALTNVTAAAVLVPGYSKKARKVSDATKQEVYLRYHMDAHLAPCPCEVDHLISLELGGANDIKNLWPQPYNGKWNARQKDRLEGWLHQQIKEGKITLAEAQRKIATSWTNTYAEAFPKKKPK
jgi:5-methylcytosine-specific restriction endonuclease McrA